MKYCLKCGFEVENDDNFCPECGHWTAKGYSFLNDKKNESIINGKMVSQQNRMAYLFGLMFLFVVLTIGICLYRGKEILYIRREITNHQYGYNTTILKTDNQYFNENIIDVKSAISKIESDFKEQNWKCKNNFEIGKIEKKYKKIIISLMLAFVILI